MAVKEKEINGVKFSVAPFSVVEALKLKPYLLKKFGPSVMQLLGVLKDGLPENGKWGDIKIDGTELSLAVEKLMMQLGEDDYIALIKRLFRNVTAQVLKDGQLLEFFFTEISFETSVNIVFEDKPFTIYPVLLLVLEANFPDFFGKMTQDIGSKIKKITTSEPEEKSSTSVPKK
jgi:hypothetical protein